MVAVKSIIRKSPPLAFYRMINQAAQNGGATLIGNQPMGCGLDGKIITDYNFRGTHLRVTVEVCDD